MNVQPYRMIDCSRLRFKIKIKDTTLDAVDFLKVKLSPKIVLPIFI